VKKTFLFLFLVPALLFAQAEDKYTLTKIGQDVPSFTVKTIDGKTISMSELKGKVVLLNFFATWCGPCMSEMPRVEKEIWQKYKGDKFIVLVIGRGHTAEDMIKFNKEKGFTFLIAPDTKNEIYGKFATRVIPRNYIIDKNGKIAFQGVGYIAEEFEKMKGKIEKLLK